MTIVKCQMIITWIAVLCASRYLPPWRQATDKANNRKPNIFFILMANLDVSLSTSDSNFLKKVSMKLVASLNFDDKLFLRKRISYEIIFSRMLRYSAPRCVHPSIHWSVSRSVGPSHYYLFYVFFTTSLLLHKRSSDAKYGPCPTAREWGSRVSGLVETERVSIQILEY